MHSGPSVKHFLGVQELSYVVPEKPFFLKNRVWFGVTPPLSVWQKNRLFLATFPKQIVLISYSNHCIGVVKNKISFFFNNSDLCSRLRWPWKSSVTWLGSPPGKEAHMGQTTSWDASACRLDTCSCKPGLHSLT